MDSLKIVGALGKRHKNDFYPTPPECTIALLDYLESLGYLKKRHTIWEPACGAYNMVNVMKDRGYNVIASDITLGQDFLTTDLEEEYSWIITNPPFNLAEQFIRKSAECKKPFAMLLKSQYWHSAKRRKLFEEHQPSFVLPLTWRPDFIGIGASMLDMIWCVWLGTNGFTFYEPLAKPKETTNGK